MAADTTKATVVGVDGRKSLGSYVVRGIVLARVDITTEAGPRRYDYRRFGIATIRGRATVVKSVAHNRYVVAEGTTPRGAYILDNGADALDIAAQPLVEVFARHDLRTGGSSEA